MKKKLFVFDIDRTIKPYFSKIPPATIQAIELLKEKYTVILATGRHFTECEAIIDELAIDYLVCNGGSDVYFKKELIYQNAPDFSKEVINLKKEKPIHFFVADHGVFSYHFPRFLKSLSYFKMFYPKSSSIYGLIDLIGRVEVPKSFKEMGTFHKFYVFGKYQGTLNYQHIKNFIHTFEYENKAVGVSYLISYLGGFDEVIAFGDSRNDIALFNIATRCYANEKGNKDLIAIATDCFEIKKGILKIVLKELESF